MKDIWPTNDEIEETLKLLNAEMFVKRYSNVLRDQNNGNKLKLRKAVFIIGRKSTGKKATIF